MTILSIELIFFPFLDEAHPEKQKKLNEIKNRTTNLQKVVFIT